MMPRLLLLFLLICSPSWCMAMEEAASSLELQEARIYHARGNELQACGALGQALFFYERAEALSPDDAVLLNDKGLLLEQLGRLKDAEDCYLKALAVNFKCLPATSNLAYLYKGQGKYDLAAEYFSKRVQYGLARDPWTLEAQMELERIGDHSPLLRRKKIARERGVLENEMALRVPVPVAISAQEHVRRVSAIMKYDRGVDLFAARRYDAAQEELEACLRLDAGHKGARHLLARIKDLRQHPAVKKPVPAGDKAAAIAAMEYDKGLRLMKDGYRQEAVKAFDRALVFAPSDADIKTALAKAREDD